MIRLGELAQHLNLSLSSAGLISNSAAAESLEITDVEHDSRQVSQGALFACIPGSHADGHDFAQAAVSAGAVALLAERRPIDFGMAVPVLLTDSVRQVLGPTAAAVHGKPSEQLDLIGVTGTNGKTTTVRLIAELLTAAGSGVTEIGTLTGLHTTPEATCLQRQLAQALHHGDQAVVMEVSSHALVQHRVDGCRFAIALFTNLGHDHLDYHGSVDAYYRAKAKLFEPNLTQRALINVTTAAGRRLADDARARHIDVTEISDDSAELIYADAESCRFRWRNQQVHLRLGGAFNMANAVMAAETAVAMGLAPAFVAAALSQVSQVPGRFEVVNEGHDIDVDFDVIVDYAHTPEGIKSVLEAARGITEGRLILVFGAGGERDRHKRPVMGCAAQAGADRVIVTSDNPRSEDPQEIIAEIVSGMDDAPYLIETDRRLAVRQALADAGAGDVIVIAGKGHESTQDLGHEILDFDDRTVAREEIRRCVSPRVATGIRR